MLSGQYRPSGKPFIDHLVGTASILAEHRADFDVVLAGLLHAAYRHGDFGTGRPGATKVKRRLVRSVVGPEAESWVHAYTMFPWSKEVMQRFLDFEPSAEERTLILMRLANELDDQLDLGVLYGADGARRQKFAAEYGERALRLAESIDQSGLASDLRGAFAATVAADLNQYRSYQSDVSDVLVLRPRSLWRRPIVRTVAWLYETAAKLRFQARRVIRKARSILGRDAPQ